MNPRLTVLLLVLVLIPACASGKKSGARDPEPAAPRNESAEQGGRGAGLWDMLEQSRRDKARRIRFQTEREREQRALNERGMAQIPPEQRQKMMRWWQEFLAQDDAWYEHRHDWRAMGQEAREILAENLLIAMIRGYEQNNGTIYRSARSELVELPTETIPYLVSGITERSGDAYVRKHCVELLGLYGDQALPAIRSGYRGRDVQARLDFLRAVKEMGALGKPRSFAFLKDALDDAEDFRLQLAAIEALGTSEDARSIPVLIDCLDDDDVSVRKFAAGSLGYYEGDRAVGPLIETMASAERRMSPDNREAEVVANCRHTLVLLTGQRFKRASQWRNWWSRR